MIAARNLTKHFGATTALGGVDFTVEAGEVHALIGENGAGKSTLLNILSGAFAADDGSIELNGERYAPGGPADARNRGIAHIHQELALCPHLSVAENILLGVEPAAKGFLKNNDMNARAAELLERFGRGEIDPRKRCGDLPLASQQVVEICRALATNARVILMDEPTSSLQRADVELLFRAIRDLAARGLAIVYISHFLEEVREIAGRFTVLRDGRSVGSGLLSNVTDAQLIAMMVGRDGSSGSSEFLGSSGEKSRRHAAVPEERRGTEEPRGTLLEVRDLASPPRLRSASFDVRAGEILGIAGLIGSGRTELLRALFGLAPATGTILVRGRDITGSGSAKRIDRGIGYLSEDRRNEGLALSMSVADNVTLSRWDTCARAGWIDLGRQRGIAERIASALRIKTSSVLSAVARLSGGNQQKVALGRLLQQDPDVLLLDEPARGIDVGSKSDIYREISALAASGKAIVIVSSYLPELFAVCDRIAVMSRGRLSPARPVAEWTPDSVMEAAIGSAESAA